MPLKDRNGRNWYSEEELGELLERAKAQGYDLSAESPLNKLTVDQVMALLDAVN